MLETELLNFLKRRIEIDEAIENPPPVALPHPTRFQCRRCGAPQPKRQLCPACVGEP